METNTWTSTCSPAITRWKKISECRSTRPWRVRCQTWMPSEFTSTTTTAPIASTPVWCYRCVNRVDFYWITVIKSRKIIVRVCSLLWNNYRYNLPYQTTESYKIWRETPKHILENERVLYTSASSPKSSTDLHRHKRCANFLTRWIKYYFQVFNTHPPLTKIAQCIVFKASNILVRKRSLRENHLWRTQFRTDIKKPSTLLVSERLILKSLNDDEKPLNFLLFV